MDQPPAISINIQLMCGEDIAMGPSKADLPETIDRHDSISAARCPICREA